MIKCLIVDDEQLARQLIASYLEKIPNLELVGSCCNSLEAIDTLQTQQVDLVFLDIQMPDLLGTEMLKSLAVRPKVIFTTAYQEYAVESYELQAIDYMLKPITFERFLQGVNKVHTSILSGNQQAYVSNEKPQKTKDYITLKTPNKVYKVKYDQILFIEGLREYLAFHTHQEKIVVLQSFKYLEQILPNNQFVRVHKSFIINIDKVNSLEGNQLNIGNHKIPIGKSYKKQVVDIIF